MDDSDTDLDALNGLFGEDDFFLSSFNYFSDYDTNLSQCQSQNEIGSKDNLINTSITKDQKIPTSTTAVNVIDENIFKENSNITKQKNRKRSPKESVTLIPQAELFRQETNFIFTHDRKRNARKELILKYHKIICQRYKLIRPAIRSEYRSINHYFNSFANQAYIILRAFQELINEGNLNYEEDYRALTQ